MPRQPMPPCKGCGKPLRRRTHNGYVRKYCSYDCRFRASTLGNILQVLADQGLASLHELRSQVPASADRIADALGKLTKKGLIARHIGLTAEGKAFIEERFK